MVWCTGFRPDYGWIRLPVAGEDGWPEQDRGVAAASPGLYFLGVPFLTGVTSMLVFGAGRDARYVSEHISARTSGFRDQPGSGAPSAQRPKRAKPIERRRRLMAYRRELAGTGIADR